MGKFQEIYDKGKIKLLFPLRLLFFSGLFTLFVLGVSIFFSWRTYKNVFETIDKTVQISDLKGDVLHFDEALTMSAKMASATGDEIWERRYHVLEIALDTTLKQLISLVPESFAAESAKKTFDANINLVKIEKQVFTAVNEGYLLQAKELLGTKFYLKEKEIYKSGMIQIKKDLELESANLMNRQAQHVAILIGFLIIAFSLIISAWLVTLRKFKNYTQVLETQNEWLDANNHQLIATEQQLRASNLQLRATEQKLRATFQQLETSYQELEGSEKKFFAFMDFFPGTVFLKDQNLKLIYINKFLKEFPGSENWLGKRPTQIFTPKMAQQIITDDQKALRDGSYRLEEKITNENGEVRDYFTNKFSITLPNGEKLLGGFSLDITDQKLAEKALVESEKNLRSVFDAAQNVSFVKVKLVNDGALIEEFSLGSENMFGYHSPEIIGKSISILHTQENINRFPEMIQMASNSKGGYSGEVTLVRKSGEHFPAFFTLFPLFDANKKLVSLLGVSIDITERKKTEEKFKTLFEESNDAIIIGNLDSVIMDVNKEALRMLGYSHDELVGKLVFDLHPKEEQERLNQLKREVKKTKGAQVFFESKFRTKKGEVIEVEINSKYYDQKNDLVQVIVRDISERKKNSLILQESEAKFRMFTNQSVEGITVADMDGNYVFVNPAFCKMSGYSKEELLKLSVFEMKAEEQPSHSFFESKGKYEGIPIRVKLKKKNGKEYITEVTGKTISINHKDLVLGTIRDISERVLAEHELIMAKEKAEESDRLKSAFLSNMSHEIRTPMNGILGFTQLLKEPQLTGPEKEEFIEVIEKSGERMLSTINDIVDISRIESGVVEIINSEFSVNEIMEELFIFFNQEAHSKGLELLYTASLTKKETTIFSDKRKLEGILTNLIKNAIKYSDIGTISFGCSIKEITGKKRLEFYIKDTGIGIPKGRINAIFNRFEQADIGDARVFEGSGLGLAISKSYVEMLGGNIRVESQEGIGSTFTFSIPYQGQKEVTNEHLIHEKMEHKSLSNLFVLVAEDDEISRFLFRSIFENKFRKIIYTKTGMETVAEIKKNPEIDIILMDIKMPRMNGLVATKKIREFNPDVKIIAQTSYGFSTDKDKALEAGCNDYLTKPIKIDVLFSKIQGLIAN